MKKIIIITIMILSIIEVNSQIKRLGKISKKEFSITDKDKEANAIILFKDVYITYDYTGNDLLQYKTVRKRILILNDKAYDYATVKGKLYKSENGNQENVSVKAYTLNLVNNKIVKTKLKRKDLFIKQVNKHWKKFSFTLPNIKPGSIIDYEYVITSPFISQIDDIYYQELIPIHYFHSSVTYPDNFKFRHRTSRFFPVHVEEELTDKSYVSQSTSVTMTGNVSQDTHTYSVDFKKNIIELTNVPAFKQEPYSNSMENFIGKVVFELLRYESNNGDFKNFAKTWEDVASTIYFDSKFGSQLKKKSFFKKDLEATISGVDNDKEKIAKILALVKNRIKWNGFYSKYSDRNIALAYKNQEGNYADVNLTLTAMLKEAGLDANPVLISTVDHGITIFPTLKGYNAVISSVKVNDTLILLDATDKYSYLNVLPDRDLNWTGRLVRKDGKSTKVSLFPEEFSIAKKKLVVSMNDDLEFSGYLVENFFGNYGLRYRHKYEGLNDEKILKSIEKKYDNNIEIEKIRTTNLKVLNKGFKIMSKLTFDTQAEDVGNKIIFSPLLFLKQKENIFKSEKRKYPIFFRFPRLDYYEVNITIPNTYKVESIPKKLIYKMPDDMGSYVYSVQINGNKIVAKVITSINLPLISNTKYSDIKEFFNKIVLKEGEKIVLIKK